MSEIQLNEPLNNNVNNNSADDEISLIDLLAVLFHYKKMICLVTVLAAVFAVIFCFVKMKLSEGKSIWTSTEIVSIDMSQFDEINQQGILSDKSNIDSVITSYISSAKLSDEIEKEFNTSGVYGTLKSKFDRKTDLLTISYTNVDSALAQKIVKFAGEKTRLFFEKKLTQKLDDLAELFDKSTARVEAVRAETGGVDIKDNNLLYSELETYYKLKSEIDTLTVVKQNLPNYFTVFQEASLAQENTSFSRGKFCIIIVFAAFFISVFIAFLLNAIKNIKNDPEVMKKFQYN